MSFPCTKCGLCCQKLDKSDILSNFHDGNGVCKFYHSFIGCVIYTTRPDVCRIDNGYEKFFLNKISLKEYYQLNAKICNQLQVERKVPEKFRVYYS